MKPTPSNRASAHTELLLLPDGRILVHNLTPAMAALLSELNPEDALMQQRAKRGAEPDQIPPTRTPAPLSKPSSP